jgi:phage shock protein C
MKKLYRSKTDKVIAGVCGGLGEYLEVDPTLLRIVYLLATVLSGVMLGVLLYIAAAVLIPQKPTTAKKK